MANHKLNLFQLALILIHAQLGISMITLVNDVHAKAKSDSWIAVLLSGLFIQCLILLFGLLLRRFPNKNLFEIIETVFGKWIGKLLILLYCCYFMLIGSILLAKYTVILKSWMMPITPTWIIVVSLLFITIYAAKENLHIITRFYFLASFVILIFIGFIIYALKDANYTSILPVANTGIVSILEGSLITSYSFQGFEYLLFISPLVLASQKQIIKTASIINIGITLFYTFMVLASQLFFNSNELKIIAEPIFYLVKSFTFRIIERPDLLFTSMWIVLVVTSSIILFYIVSIGFVTLFETKNRTFFLVIAAIISCFISIYLYGEYRINYFMEKFNLFIIVFSASLPLFVLLISYVLRRKEDEEQ